MSETLNLLDKAKSCPSTTRKRTPIPTDEEVALCLAWLADQVTLTQVTYAANTSLPESYVLIARGLRVAYKQGLLEIES